MQLYEDLGTEKCSAFRAEEYQTIKTDHKKTIAFPVIQQRGPRKEDVQ